MARPVQRLASVRVLATATPQDIRSNAGMPLLNMLDRIQAQESVVCIHLRKGSPHLEDDTTDNVLSDALKIDPLCRYADAGFEILDVYHGPEWRKRPDKGGKGQYWNPQGMNTPLCAEMRLSPLQDRWEEWGPRAAVDDEGDLLVQQGQDGQEYALMIHSWGGHLLVLARLPQAVDPDRESGPRKFCALCCKTIPVAWFNQPCHFHPGNFLTDDDDSSSIVSTSSDGIAPCCGQDRDTAGCAIETSHLLQEDVDSAWRQSVWCGSRDGSDSGMSE